MNPLKARFHAALRSTERYTKTDMVYAFSGSFWLGLTQVASSVSALLLGVVFAHFLTKDVYGIYKYVLSIGALISAFSFSGLGTSIVQSVASGDEEALRRGFRNYLKTGVIITVLGAGIATFYLIKGNAVLGTGVLIAGIALPFIGAATLYDSYLQGKRLFKLSALYGALNTIFPALVLIGIVYVAPHPLPILIGYFVLNAFVDLAIYWYTVRKFSLPRSRTFDTTSTDTYGSHLSVMNIFMTVATQVDQLILFHFFGAVELAVYAFAIAIPEQAKGFLKNVGTLALPKFVRDSESATSGIAYKTLVMSILIAIPVGVYILAAPYIFAILFPAYKESVIYSQIFAVSLISGSNVIPLALLQARQETKKLYVLNVASGIFQIGLIVLLGVLYGILGVVIARVVARFATGIGTLLLAEHHATSKVRT